jgi:hypothetical protein
MTSGMDWWARLSQPCPVAEGTRIELVSMGDDPDPVEPGTRGTVTGGNGDQVFVEWDNGRTLILLVEHDRWRVLTDE